MTLDEAQSIVRAALASGEMITCPCCGQVAKVYSRRLHSGMLRSLIEIAAAGDDGLTSVQVLAQSVGNTDYYMMRYWGLISLNDEDKRWRITLNGLKFLRGEISIPKYVNIFNATFLGFSGKHVSVKDCERKRFDKDELMSTSAEIRVH